MITPAEFAHEGVPDRAVMFIAGPAGGETPSQQLIITGTVEDLSFERVVVDP